MPVLCPHCDRSLQPARTPFGIGWLCPLCLGRAANLSVMRRAVREPFMREIWWQASRQAGEALTLKSQKCPSCRHAMRTVMVAGEQGAVVQLSVCTACQMVWMEANELEALPRAAPPSPVLSQADRERLAMFKVEAMREGPGSSIDRGPPDEWWHAVMSLFGLPVEENAPPLRRRPSLTWNLAAAMGAMTIFRWLGQVLRVVPDWGIHHGNDWPHVGLDWIIAFFLHGSVWHLVGNLYLLLTFGDNVEDMLGRRWFALLVGLAVVVGNTLYLMLSTSSEPLIGANGAISGILVFYALALPRVHLSVPILNWMRREQRPFRGNVGSFSVPVWWVLVCWIILQVITAATPLRARIETVSGFADFGGAAVGLIAWWLWRGRFAQIPTIDP